MKLFVWADPYQIEGGNSALFAVAETIEQARALAKKAPGYAHIDLKGHPDRNVTLCEPIRIVDLPCAEWHEWSK